MTSLTACGIGIAFASVGCYSQAALFLLSVQHNLTAMAHGYQCPCESAARNPWKIVLEPW